TALAAGEEPLEEYTKATNALEKIVASLIERTRSAIPQEEASNIVDCDKESFKNPTLFCAKGPASDD
ncbi:hypothetical protein L249_6004, partial [Ophiocordyceps polyrhachis-furcata BCC 54312]